MLAQGRPRSVNGDDALRIARFAAQKRPAAAGKGSRQMAKQPIRLTQEIVPPPALARAGLETLPAIIRARGERASRRFIEFFTASIATATGA